MENPHINFEHRLFSRQSFAHSTLLVPETRLFRQGVQSGRFSNAKSGLTASLRKRKGRAPTSTFTAGDAQ